MALLNQKKRIATVKCVEDCELIAIRRADFHILVTNFGDLREQFKQTEKSRLEQNKDLKDLFHMDVGNVLKNLDDDLPNSKVG